MSILESIRDTLAAVFGGADATEDFPADNDPSEAGNDPSAADDTPAERDPTQLDPEGVTETRTAATDDAVDALRTLRQPPDGTKPVETSASDGQDPTDRDAADGKESNRETADPTAGDHDANH